MFGLPMGPEWLIILVIVVIIFGVGKLPEIGGAMGKSIREFKSNVKDNEPVDKSVTTTTVAKETTPVAKSNDTTNA